MSVRIQILGDLHLEVAVADIPVAGDIVVLAGDIAGGADGVSWARQSFGGRNVLYVPGNHEFYRRVYPNVIQDLREAASDSNVRILERDEVVLDGVRYLGTTLWTDFSLGGFSRQDAFAAAAKHGMNDFRTIRRATGELLRPQDVALAHRESVAWLRERLSTPFAGQTVVITHHAPCVMSVDPALRFDLLAPAFASNQEGLILEHAPELWIHGHTHYCCDYYLGSTRVVSNQRGYAFGECDPATKFDPAFVVEM